MATNVRPRPDFGENEATIVDAGHGVTGDIGDNDATRPVGPAIKRGTAEMPSGKFDLGPDDPAHDQDARESRTAPLRKAMPDEEDIVTSARRLPKPSLALPVLQPAVDVDVEVDDDHPPSQPLPGVRPARGQEAPKRRPPQPFGRFGDDEATSDLGPKSRTSAASATGARPPSGTRPVSSSSFDEPDAPTVSARSRPVQPLPQSSSDAATLTLPPSQHPLGNQSNASSGSRAALKASFDEPTHIPPAIPPPIDSGRWEPRLSDSQHPPMAQPYSPLQQTGEQPNLRHEGRGMRILLIVIAVALALALAALAAVMLGAVDARATLSIVSLPAGAEVRVDGNAASSLTPLQLVDIDPRQTHHVRVSKAGWDAWESDVKFAPHEREVRVQAVLVPAVGTLSISVHAAGRRGHRQRPRRRHDADDRRRPAAQRRRRHRAAPTRLQSRPRDTVLGR